MVGRRPTWSLKHLLVVNASLLGHLWTSPQFLGKSPRLPFIATETCSERVVPSHTHAPTLDPEPRPPLAYWLPLQGSCEIISRVGKQQARKQWPCWWQRASGAIRNRIQSSDAKIWLLPTTWSCFRELDQAHRFGDRPLPSCSICIQPKLYISYCTILACHGSLSAQSPHSHKGGQGMGSSTFQAPWLSIHISCSINIHGISIQLDGSPPAGAWE